MKLKHTVGFICVLGVSSLVCAQSTHPQRPYPILTMPGNSKPLVAPPSTSLMAAHAVVARAQASSTAPAVMMKVLVLAGDSSEYSYQSITGYLNQIGVPYQGIAVDTLTPDGNGNRLSRLVLSDPATGRGLYQGIIETNSTFGVCNPTCVNLLSAADFTTLNNYASQFKVRVASYYTYPEAKWGLAPVGSGASYTSASPLSVSVTPAGASIFSYINSKNAIPVSGSGTGGIYAYLANPVAAAGETTTSILSAGANTVGVTHTTSDGRETMSLLMDNYPTLLHSLAFSYGVINWVTKGVFLGSRQIYINSQDDDILFGDRLYAPTLPQCPNDPSCPDVRGTATDIQALVNWQNTKHQDPQLPFLRVTFAFVGFGSTPGFAPYQDTLPGAMTEFASQFGWVTHTWTHGALDCYTTSSTGTCIPATLSQSLFEIERNAVYAQSIGIPADSTGLVTPFNAGLTNQAFLQAAVEEGVTSIISPDDPPSPGVGMVSPLAPSILLIPRRVTNLFYDADSPQTGAYGSLPDEYNSFYGPNGKTPVFTQNQTYSQIIDNESTLLLQTRMLNYESYPLGFHTSNSIFYDGVHSLFTDLMDATIQKYERIFSLPVNTLQAMRDIAPLLANRASYNSSGVTGVYTPGVSIVLTTVNPATIPVTGACSQASCPIYGGQMQDSVLMPANSSVTLSLTAGVGVGLSSVSMNPATVTAGTPSQGLIVLNGVAPTSVIVSLSSNNASVVVPSTITVSPGDSGAAFIATTGPVNTPTTAIVSATYNHVTKTFPLTVTPAIALSGISLNLASVVSGNGVTGTVFLTAAAPAGGILVSLVSNNLAANPPASVTVPAGSSSASFSIATTVVTASSTGGILAIYNGVTETSPLTITAAPSAALSSVSMNPTSVISGIPSTGTVTLTGAAPVGGIVVSLSSNSAAAVVPASVIVAAGSSSATFTAATTSVAASTAATISAVYSGATKTAGLTVNPAVALSGLSLNPASVTGGTRSTGTILLTGVAPSGGIVVSLSSNNAAAIVPGSVTVPAGSSSTTFSVTTTSVNAAVTATIGASYNGVGKTFGLTVTPPVLLSRVSLNPSSVTGGSSSTGTVTLTGAAPSGGLVVTLSSNNAAVVVPGTVTVAGGASSVTFTANTTAVSSSTISTVTAAYNGVSKTSSLTVIPAALSGFSFNPAVVKGGASTTATVTLTGPAPAGGISINVLIDLPFMTDIPWSITIPAGSSSTSLNVQTITFFFSLDVNVTASYGGINKSATLTINP